MPKQQQDKKKLWAGGSGGADPAPGPSSAVAEQQARRAFTQNAIKALLELQNRPALDQATLAGRAWEKLQWDLPLLSSQEVDALAQQYRNSLACKELMNPPPPVTPQLLTNATQAVLAAAKPSKQASSTPPAPTKAAATSSHTTATPDTGPGSTGLLEVAHTSHAALAAAYQRLSAVLLLNVPNAVLSLPVQDACQVLSRFLPYMDDGAVEQQQQQQQQQQVLNQVDALTLLEEPLLHPAANGLPAADAAAVVVATGISQGIHQPVGHSDRAYTDVEAAEQDDDETAYEPLMPAAPAVKVTTGNSHGSRCVPARSNGHVVDKNSWTGMSTAQWGIHGSTTANGGFKCLDQQGQEKMWQEVQAGLLAVCSQTHLAALTTLIPHPQPCASTGHSNVHMGTADLVHESQGVKAHAKALSNGSSTAGSGGRMVLGARDTNRSAEAAAAVQGSCAVQAREQLLWEDHAVQQGLLQLIRTLGVHSNAHALQPLLAAYTNVAVEWMGQTPSCVEQLLGQVWDALGVGQIARMPRIATNNRSSGGGEATEVLLPEAVLALSMVLQLSQKLPQQGRGRAALWQQVNTHLLPVLARCLSDVAAASSHQAGAARALSAVCQVIVFYILHRPGNFRAGEALQSAGVLRRMCALWPTWAALPAADLLRQALLLCVACSPSCLRWALAVPGFKQSLSSPAFQAGSCAQAHGTVWQLLLTQAGMSEVMAGSGIVQLEAILDQVVTDRQPQQVQCLHDSLQLMCSVQQASDGKVSWQPSVQQAMRAALAQLRQRGPTTPAAGQDAGRANMPTSINGDKEQHMAGGQEGDAPEEHHLVQLEALQQKQWEAGCVAALKDLLAQGAKKD